MREQNQDSLSDPFPTFFATMLSVITLIILIVGGLARWNGLIDTTRHFTVISSHAYNTVEQNRVAAACRHYTCKIGETCVLSERGVLCMK